MALFGLRRELYSVFQYAYQFVAHFEGRVGRVWASVRREFRIAWALLPFAKGELLRPWDTTAHAPDASLAGMGIAALTAPLTVVKDVGSISGRWRFKGRCVQLRNLEAFWTGRSALLISTSSIWQITKPLILVLSSLTSRRFTLPRNGECSAQVPGSAQRVSWWSSARQPFALSSRKSQSRTSALNPFRQYVMVVRGQQRSVINLVSRPACTRIVWFLSCL